eukprot:TRINITY_DN9189_c0_g1_i1.p1 TRINITY_DN9189_c0_g1~~TRINITY_DN9189_c0_g1_i1.p1  ORF type:complete len:268 (+),score=31.86 TRINITY_DN9189_c0_g1_i1:76-879(+)
MDTSPKITKSNLSDELLFTLTNVLSQEECRSIIDRANEKGWNKSSPSGGGHGRTGREDPRTNSFCVWNDQQLADKVWKRVKPFLQPDLTHIPFNTYLSAKTKGAEWKPVGVVDKIRVYKYEVGEAFPEHVDYKSGRDVMRETPNGLQKYRQQTFFTLLIYLNDEFSGGETGYWTNHQGIHCRFLRDCEWKPHQHVIIPQNGTCVVQEQNILHEGTPIQKGRKYVLRTDIIHEKPCASYDEKHNKKSQLNSNPSWERIFETSCKNYAD